MHGWTLSATDFRDVRTKRQYMPLDLVGSKIMTVYVAAIKGRGTGAFHANNGSDAKRFARDRVFATISWSWRTFGIRAIVRMEGAGAPAFDLGKVNRHDFGPYQIQRHI